MRPHCAPLLMLVVACFLSPEAGAERAAIVVTNTSCRMESISMLDVRKAYFAIALSYDDIPVRAYRFNGDEELNRIFYQTVAGMSEKSYQRRLLSMTVKFGSPRPPEIADIAGLVGALRDSRCGIAYMWREDADKYPEIKDLLLLWQGD